MYFVPGIPGLPLYVGYDNYNKEQGKVGYTPYYYTPEEAYAKVGTSGTPIGASEQPDSVLDFEGYDAKGHKIDKIPMITNELISGIVKEHNEKYGTWQCNEDGILHYYHVGTDTGGKEFLKEVTDPEAIEKKEYALAIGTMYIEEENREKVNVRIRPGYNFSFESMDRIFSFVYVYDDIEEMFDSLTIIQSLQENDVLIPRIYKSIKDDAFGSNYGFGSVEKGPGFSTLWLAPNTSRVVVGFQTTEAKEGDVNGAKLVGHLAVPQADVVLGGGDFNGGVIAHNVDAITCGSEGHMWPFLIGAGTEVVQIRGRKTVDAHPPGENEVFSFQADLQMKNDTGEYITVGEPMVVTSDPAGGFVFRYPEDTLEPGEYQILVTCTPYGINSHRLLVRGHRVDAAQEETVVSKEVRRADKRMKPLLIFAAAAFGLAALSGSLYRRYRESKSMTEERKRKRRKKKRRKRRLRA